jgi:hypothetical protein
MAGFLGIKPERPESKNVLILTLPIRIHDAPASIRYTAMIVNVTINRQPSGRVTICVTTPSPWTYNTPRAFSSDKAHAVLIDFGFDEFLVTGKLKQLEEYEPKERIGLGDKDIPHDTLGKHGFKVPDV